MGVWGADGAFSLGEDVSAHRLWSGDPYGEPDRVLRGVSLAVPPVALTDLFLGDVQSKTLEFSPIAVPPSQPEDPFFRLAPTTLFLRGLSACQLGNDLLAFLQDQAAASIVKLRRNKFTIKAEAQISSTPVTVKLRVYSTGEGAFAVEVHRRDGDAVAFAVLFAMLAQSLKRYSQHTQPPNQLVVLRGCTSQALLAPDAPPIPFLPWGRMTVGVAA